MEDDGHDDQNDETNDCSEFVSGTEHDSDTTNNEYARVNRIVLSKKSDEYRQRRERNNAAVKKSRFKSKQKTIETQKRVEQLKSENEQLERRLESLSREFDLMRDIFVPRRVGQQPMRFQGQSQPIPGYPAAPSHDELAIGNIEGRMVMGSTNTGQPSTSGMNYGPHHQR